MDGSPRRWVQMPPFYGRVSENGNLGPPKWTVLESFDREDDDGPCKNKNKMRYCTLFSLKTKLKWC